jgi:ABC-type phosphate/phosphonate transport system substrate-binding protein
MKEPVIVGAVMYDPKVSVIWEIIGSFFETKGCPIDTKFYRDYDLLVSALLDNSVEIGWLSPLAWLDLQRRLGGGCRAIAMRDTDRDRRSFVLAKRGGPVRNLPELRGRGLAVGARDSPQATLVPLGLLRHFGIDPDSDLTLTCFDLMVGLHGDHVGGELEAFRSLERGEVAACVMLDLNWHTDCRAAGTTPPGRTPGRRTDAHSDCGTRRFRADVLR